MISNPVFLLGLGIGILIGGGGVALFVFLCFDKLHTHTPTIIFGEDMGKR